VTRPALEAAPQIPLQRLQLGDTRTGSQSNQVEFNVDNQPGRMRLCPDTRAGLSGRGSLGGNTMKVSRRSRRLARAGGGATTRELEVSGFPIIGADGFQGAIVLFWPVTEGER